MAKRKVKDEMLFTDKKIFGDNNEHEYNVVCDNGKGIATPTEDELECFPNSPKKITLTYPTLEELTKEQKRECLNYRGLYDVAVSRCNYADVCMSYGKLSVEQIRDMAKTKTDWTRIVFRTFKSGVAKGEVIALMIDDEWSRGQVASYMHIGQHSGADYNGIIAVTRRATPEEVAPLADELHRIGYSNIEVMYRRGRKRKVA